MIPPSLFPRSSRPRRGHDSSDSDDDTPRVRPCRRRTRRHSVDDAAQHMETDRLRPVRCIALRDMLISQPYLPPCEHTDPSSRPRHDWLHPQQPHRNPAPAPPPLRPLAEADFDLFPTAGRRSPSPAFPVFAERARPDGDMPEVANAPSMPPAWPSPPLEFDSPSPEQPSFDLPEPHAEPHPFPHASQFAPSSFEARLS